MDAQRIAAFSQGTNGGNPAGVVLCDALPASDRMLAIAAEVGYSETVFAAPTDDGWRVRYFAPEIEVPFCGHATIALGAALALAHGDGTFALQLNDTQITVTGWRKPALKAALQSPRTRSEPAPKDLVERALGLFSYTAADLDPRLPPAIAAAGARHLVLALTSRQKLAAMRILPVVLLCRSGPPLLKIRNIPILPAIPPRHEGRYGQSSRNVRRGAMDVWAASDERCSCIRRNRVVRMPRRWYQVQG